MSEKELFMPPGIPRAAEAIFRTLMESALPTPRDLEDALDAYEESLASSPISYAPKLVQLARQLLVMLYGGGLSELERCWVLVAIHYLVIEDDGAYDHDGFEGLEDDAGVLNAVAAAIGRSELRVQVD